MRTLRTRLSCSAGVAALFALASSPHVALQAQVAPATNTERPANAGQPQRPRGAFFQSVPLGDGPWTFDTREHKIRVDVVTKNLENPWGLAFLPNGDMLVTERPGRLRLIESGALRAEPVSGLPEIHARGLGGLLDVALHPEFSANRLIYFSYSKPGELGATTAVARARYDGGLSLSGVEDVLVADAWHTGTGAADGSYGSRIVFGTDGLLYMTLGERNLADKAQEPGTHLGKILRLDDEGAAPADNPFVERRDYRPEIYSLGHRNPLGLAVHPLSGALWSTEQGPQGGDEINVILPGRNYGWPLVSFGRNYDGTIVGIGPVRADLEPPLVFWVPAIAISGLAIYAGDAFPEWRGNAFVGAMRVSGQANTGHIQRVFFNEAGLPVGREPLLVDLKQRIRDVRVGPDGLIYALTDEPVGALLRISPAP